MTRNVHVFGALLRIRLVGAMWVATALVLVAPLQAASGDVQIVGVAPLARDGRVLVSFELAGAFTDDIKAAIRSGLPTTFTYVVELRRTTTLWFDRTITSATISVSVRYDNLRRHHQVSYMLDGRVEETRLVEDEETVRQLMTTFEHVALFSTTPLEPNGEYYVRVRAKTEARSLWFFWPWDRIAASATANFTFIP